MSESDQKNVFECTQHIQQNRLDLKHIPMSTNANTLGGYIDTIFTNFKARYHP